MIVVFPLEATVARWTDGHVGLDDLVVGSTTVVVALLSVVVRTCKLRSVYKSILSNGFGLVDSSD